MEPDLYMATPGSDVGVTKEDYAWLLRQCKATADWQLPEHVTWNGRLLKNKPRRFQYRGQLHEWADYVGDGETVDNFELGTPPFGAWRARVRPLRQEPEWTLNDLDVAESWRQLDEAALYKSSPTAMLALATDAVSMLHC